MTCKYTSIHKIHGTEIHGQYIKPPRDQDTDELSKLSPGKSWFMIHYSSLTDIHSNAKYSSFLSISFFLLFINASLDVRTRWGCNYCLPLVKRTDSSGLCWSDEICSTDGFAVWSMKTSIDQCISSLCYHKQWHHIASSLLDA